MAINSLERGGLGIGSIAATNIPLLSKWVWKFRFDPNSSWSKVMKVIHGQNGGLNDDREAPGSCDPWSRILKTWRLLNEIGLNIDDLMSKQIGDGNSTMFWHDN